MWSTIAAWLDFAPAIVLGLIILLAMTAAGWLGKWLRTWSDRDAAASGQELKESQEGYLVSAVVGLLALLVGFTFSLAVDRFETRRSLVLQEANAIGTAYLRTQLLEEPHRTRLSRLLVAYTENRLVLSKVTDRSQLPPLLARNDRLATDLWQATVAAFPTIRGYDFSSTYLESMNEVIDLDRSRKAARLVRIPTEVFVVLVIYMIVTAAVMGFVLIGPRGRTTGFFLMFLTNMAVVLIIDIDRPARGGITEGQRPMEWLRDDMREHPPSTYDRFLLPEAPSRQAPRP